MIKEDKGYSMDITKTIKRLKAADKAYFESGDPIMSDSKYDQLKELLQKETTRARPKVLVDRINSYLGLVGHAPTKARTKLEVAMPSLSKVKNDNDQQLESFLRKLRANGETHILQSPKLDGSSLLVNYRVSKSGDCATLESARTRGDGSVGRDVTAHAKVLFRGLVLPKTIRSTKLKSYTLISVRGELVMPKKAFKKKWQDRVVEGKKLTEARNAVNGFVNSKSINSEFARDLKFIAFNIYADGKEILPRHKIIRMLTSTGFSTYAESQVGDYYPIEDLKVKKLKKDLARVGDEPYDCDGLVLEAVTPKVRHSLCGKNRPEHSIAYKVGHTDLEGQEVHTTTVTKIEWNTSKTGALIPLVHYKPVKFGSTTNTKANGIHHKNIKDLGLGVGAKIKVIRSGGVIPRIIKVVNAVEPKYPKRCECGAPIIRVGIHLYCSIPTKCTILAKELLISALRHLKVDGYGGTKVQQVYDAGYTDINKLLVKGTKSKLLKLDRWGDKAASTARDNLLKSLEKVSTADLMVVSGKFVEPGFSLASSRCNLAVQTLGKDPLKWSTKSSKKLAQTKGFGTVASKCFSRCLPDFQKWIKEFCSAYTAVAGKPVRFR